MKRLGSVMLVCVPLVLGQSTAVGAAVLTFDGLSDLDSVDSSYSGLDFTNATVLTAGLSLNEFEFPPHSGTNIAFDDGGPVRVEFAVPVASVGGYFTYLVPVTLEAFSMTGTLLGVASSTFTSNLALSGDPGSNPNEYLGITVLGIAYVVLTGDVGGGSFALDDFGYEAETHSVPEPPTLGLILAALMGFSRRRCRS